MMNSKFILDILMTLYDDCRPYPSWCGTEDAGGSGAVLGLAHGSSSRPPLPSHYAPPTPMIHDCGVAEAKCWLCVEIPHVMGFCKLH